MFEPRIITDTSMLPKSIETNLDELEPIIAEKCALANSLVVSPDSIEECEKAAADATLLTKLSERIKRCRLDWTASWQSPFEGVIAKCKDYEKRLADAATNLRSKANVGMDKLKVTSIGAGFEWCLNVRFEGEWDPSKGIRNVFPNATDVGPGWRVYGHCDGE